MGTRENILQTSFLMFLDRGFGEVSLNEIIKEAGTTKGGFYHYFKSKDELIEYVTREYIFPFYKKPLENIEEKFSESECKSAYDKLLCYYKDLPCVDMESAGHTDEDGDFRNFSFLIFEGMKKYSYIGELRHDIMKIRTDLVRELLEEGKKEGIINENIDALQWADVINTLKEGIIALNLLDSTIDVKEKCELSFMSIWEEIKKQ